MKLDEIMKLVDAGFTKNDIQDLLALNKEVPAEGSEYIDSPEQQVTKPSEPEAGASPVKDRDDALNSELNDLMNEIRSMRDDLKKRSLIEDAFRPEDSRSQAEQILASVINPPAKKAKKGN